MIWNPHPVNNIAYIRSFYSLFAPFYDKGFTFTGEAHNFWEFMYVRDGEIRVSADGRIYELKSGDLICHMPLEMHKFEVSSHGGAHLLIFSFSLEGKISDFLKNKVFALSSLQKKIISSMTEYMDDIILKYSIDCQKAPYFAQYLIAFDRDEGYAQSVTSYIYELLLSLADNTRTIEKISTPESDAYAKAVSYMNQKVCSALTIADIASYCNVSEATLKRLFSKYSGIGVHKYFLKLKISSASEMLKCGKTVSEVSDFLGFSSQAYFSNTYKRETGINPSDLKK